MSILLGQIAGLLAGLGLIGCGIGWYRRRPAPQVNPYAPIFTVVMGVTVVALRVIQLTVR